MPYRGAEVELCSAQRAKAALCLAQGKDASPAQIIMSAKPSCRTEHIIAVGPERTCGTIAFSRWRPPSQMKQRCPALRRRIASAALHIRTTAAPKGVPVDYVRFRSIRAQLARARIDPRIDPALARPSPSHGLCRSIWR